MRQCDRSNTPHGSGEVMKITTKKMSAGIAVTDKSAKLPENANMLI